MGSQHVTRPQVSGYRFGLRRLESAVVRRSVRSLNDPLRSHTRALIAGGVLAAVALAGSAIIGLVRPQSHLGDAKIVVTKNGALFVRMGDTLHPALNLASARLIAGEPANPVSVSDKALGDLPRGPVVGIPGAPSTLPVDPYAGGRAWSVCDISDSGRLKQTVVVAGKPANAEQIRPLTSTQAVLMASGSNTYLVYDGKRAKVDTSDGAVTRALGIEGKTGRAVSTALLGAIPESTTIRAPDIPGTGGSGPGTLSRFRVGAIIQTNDGTAVQFYVVLANGVQEVSSVVKDLLRFSDPRSEPTIPMLAPNELRDIPPVSPLDVASYPSTPPQLADDAVECLTWAPDAGVVAAPARTSILSGLGLPIAAKAKPVALAQADGSGPSTDAVYVPPGTGIFAKTDTLFYVSDTGVRFGITDADAAKMLGLSKPEPASWPILSLLAPGPALGRTEAFVAHDGVG